MTIWTIGHSTRSFSDFLAALQNEKIEILADVRALPGSRRYPQYNQKELATRLEENQIGYRHFPALGGRRKPATNSTNTAWRNPSFRAYADHIESEDFKKGIEALIDQAKRCRTAIMCSEAVWWRCHRSLISDYLKIRGWTVLHIFEARNVKEHPYTSAAGFDEDGRLTYRASAPRFREKSPNG